MIWGTESDYFSGNRELKPKQLPPKYGEELIAGHFFDFPLESLETIGKHRGTSDGEGYLGGLSGDRIPLLVKPASVVKTYDNHCNKCDPTTSLTPYQALSCMFGKQSEQFERESCRIGRFFRLHRQAHFVPYVVL